MAAVSSSPSCSIFTLIGLRHSSSYPRTICPPPSASVDSQAKCRWNPQPGLSWFSSWDGLRRLGFSNPKRSAKIERNARWKGNGYGVNASLFGVGAPEALVVGVVALLVFGPKGLAEVARNLGKTLRAFQPTIRELQDVSREFKSSLEREIGVDETQDQTRTMYTSNPMDFTPVVSQTDTDDPKLLPHQMKNNTITSSKLTEEEQLKSSHQS